MSFRACAEAKDVQLAPTRSWRTGRPARRRQIVSVCLILRRRLPAGLSLSRSYTGAPRGKGNTQHPALGQFRSKPRMEIISFVSSRRRKSSSTKTVKVIACPRRQRGDVAGIVPDYPVHRFGVAPDSGGDYRIRDQRRPRARRFNHPLHLPSAPSAADRLSACGC